MENNAFEYTYSAQRQQEVEEIRKAYLPKEQDKHYIDLTLLHNDNRVLNIFGDYYNDSIKPGIDANAVLTHFPLQLSEAFLKESGLSLSGYIDGDLSLKGNIEEPHSNGYVHFDSVSAEAPVFGARLHLKDDKVEIKDNKLNLRISIFMLTALPYLRLTARWICRICLTPSLILQCVPMTIS